MDNIAASLGATCFCVEIAGEKRGQVGTGVCGGGLHGVRTQPSPIMIYIVIIGGCMSVGVIAQIFLFFHLILLFELALLHCYYKVNKLEFMGLSIQLSGSLL